MLESLALRITLSLAPSPGAGTEWELGDGDEGAGTSGTAEREELLEGAEVERESGHRPYGHESAPGPA